MFVVYTDTQRKDISNFLNESKKKNGFGSVVIEYLGYDNKMQINFRFSVREEERTLKVYVEGDFPNITDRFKRIIFSIYQDNEVLNFIAKNHYLELYPKNIDTLKSRKNDTEYFIDSLYVWKLDKNGRKKSYVRHDEIGFDNLRMIQK